MKHTPTPWTDSMGMAQRPVVTAVTHTADIAAMSLSGGKSLDEAYANAAFIVRACNAHYDLVEALEATIPAMGTDISDVDIVGVFAKARAALAKAKGE